MSNSASLPERGAYRRSDLLEFLAAEIDGLDGPHVGDVIEGIFLQDQKVGGLALGQRAEFFVDAQGLRGALREGLDYLHRRQA